MQVDINALLSAHELRATQPRRMVVEALAKSKAPLSHKDIHALIASKGGVSLVTVYRILDAFERVGLVHRHLSSGGFVLCSLQKNKGHHILLHCQDCGTVEECTDADFCTHENRIARRNGFSPKMHFSELIGVCAACS